MKAVLCCSSLFAPWLFVLSLFVLWLPAPLSFAVVEGHKYPFDNQQDTDRFNQLAEDLRCPKCQNQNLADSNAPVARDMRDKMYELLQQGESDDQVVAYMVARYGDFVRYKPPVKNSTYLLWFGPVILFVVGVIVLVMVRRNSQSQPSRPLTPKEKARLQALTHTSDSSDNKGHNV